MSGISRPQVSAFANGSVYWVPPLIVPLVEKSSVEYVFRDQKLYQSYFSVVLTLICYSFHETDFSHEHPNKGQSDVVELTIVFH